MKNTIFTLILCTLFIPSLVSAQTQAASSTPASSAEVAALILQLQAKIQELQQQLATLQASSIPSEDGPSDAIALHTLTQTLSRGMSNDQVADLQRYLAMHSDIYPEGLITGYFGALTEQAVKRLQVAKGLEPVGIVGPKTRVIINTEIIPLSARSSGGGVSSPTVVSFQSGSAMTTVALQTGATTSSSTAATPATNTTTSSTASTTSATPSTSGNVTSGGSSSGGSSGSTAATTTLDTTPPSVSLSAPIVNATVSNTATLIAAATDNVGVVGVQFMLDGVNLGSEDTSSPFSMSWDTTGAVNGAHTLSARARDAAGNQTTSSSISVTVSNAGTIPDTIPPSVSITSPASGATVSGIVVISATASDNIGVTTLHFRADGGVIGEVSAPPYGFSWNTTGVSNGTHTLTVIAHDAAGNITTSSSVSITVNNITVDTTPPSVSVVSPRSGSTIISDIIVSASANDNVGVSGVSFFLDGILFGSEDQSSPYTQTLSTGGYSTGLHSLAVVARDAAGNTATSSATIYTYKTRPTLTDVSLPTTVLSVGTKVLAKVAIAANTQGAVAWRKLTASFSKSSNVTLGDFQIIDVSNAQPVPGVTVSSIGDTTIFTSSVDQEIVGTKTYEIRATVSGTLQAGDYVTTSVQPSESQYASPSSFSSVSSSAYVVWSDLSVSPHSDTSLDWHNDFPILYSAHQAVDRTLTY